MLVWAWGLLKPALYQHLQKQELERILAERPPEPAVGFTSPVPMTPIRRPPTGGRWPRATGHWLSRDPLALGEIRIPRLAMEVIVREGMDDSTLSLAAGHVPDTALPGEPGNFVVLGHRDTLFRPLRGLEKGERVRVRTTNGDFNYSIDSIEVVAPEDVQLREAREPAITMITCFPFDFIGPAPRRFVARGHLETK